MPVDPALDPQLAASGSAIPAGAAEGWSSIVRSAHENGYYENGDAGDDDDEGEGDQAAEDGAEAEADAEEPAEEGDGKDDDDE